MEPKKFTASRKPGLLLQEYYLIMEDSEGREYLLKNGVVPPVNELGKIARALANHMEMDGPSVDAINAAINAYRDRP